MISIARAMLVGRSRWSRADNYIIVDYDEEAEESRVILVPPLWFERSNRMAEFDDNSTAVADILHAFAVFEREEEHLLDAELRLNVYAS